MMIEARCMSHFARQFRFGGALAAVLLASALAAACGDGANTSLGPSADGDSTANLLGGATTIFDDTPNAFTFPARNLSAEHRDSFALGDHFFNRAWVTAPASIEGNDGLGPTYNALSCSTCHNRDGRGAPPSNTDASFVGLLFRLSIPGVDSHGGPLDEPNYGGQLNPLAILGMPPEGTPQVNYTERSFAYDDGETYSLRAPTYTFSNLAYGPFAENAMVSPRVAPAMIGLGLLEAIAEETLTRAADPDDRDGDGISGRVNHVWDVLGARSTVGRFGWKANQPTVRQQTAGAFLGDIGITSSLFPAENCPKIQTKCAEAPSGGTPEAPELSAQKLDATVVYGMTVAVPARRTPFDAVARRGEALFEQAGCAGCHTPKVTTGDLAGFPELSQQTIRPFTDLLLHDMGDELSDGRPDFEATGNEWRTAPLWGIGLVARVSRHTFFLHDGRARNVTEAILWHAGEASRARDAFRSMAKASRDALVAFLESL
jgi:CxxC motif-containing protein (DUF1111 family)